MGHLLCGRYYQPYHRIGTDDLHLLHEDARRQADELTEGHPYKNNVAAFIRVINGIDRQKALQIYQQFIEGYNLTSDQEIYLKNILDYISMNGDIETRNFLEYPLKDLKWRETFGDTFVNLKDFIKQMHRVIIA